MFDLSTLSVYETGWVIEYGESDPSNPAYWIGPTANPAEWPFGLYANDHSKAVRFARREDAEAVVAIIKLHANDHIRCHFRVAEHAWC